MTKTGTVSTLPASDARTMNEPMDADTRSLVQELIEEGRTMIPALADWGRRARPLLDYPIPGEAYEDAAAIAELGVATGLAELNDVMFVIGLVGADPDSPPSEAAAKRLLKEYADLIGAVTES